MRNVNAVNRDGVESESSITTKMADYGANMGTHPDKQILLKAISDGAEDNARSSSNSFDRTKQRDSYIKGMSRGKDKRDVVHSDQGIPEYSKNAFIDELSKISQEYVPRSSRDIINENKGALFHTFLRKYNRSISNNEFKPRDWSRANTYKNVLRSPGLDPDRDRKKITQSRLLNLGNIKESSANPSRVEDNSSASLKNIS